MTLIQSVDVEQNIIDQARKMNARYVLLKQAWRLSLMVLLVLFLGLAVWKVIGQEYFAARNLARLEASLLTQAQPTESATVSAELNSQPSVTSGSLRMMVYSASRADSDVLTSITQDNDFQIVGRKPGWKQIALTSGVPVWIELDSVERLAGGRVKVNSDLCFAFSKPSSTESEIVGVIYQGDELGEIRKQGSWVRVWSPPRFLAWIKEADLPVSESRSG